MLDVPVHAHGAAVHDASRASGGSSLDDRPHGRRVDRAVLGLRQAGLPVNRGDVIDDLDAADRAIERSAILERRRRAGSIPGRRRTGPLVPDRGRTHGRRSRGWQARARDGHR